MNSARMRVVPSPEPRAPRVFRNALILSVSNLANFVLYGANAVILAHFLGREYLGRYAAVVAAVQVLGAIADLGLYNVLLRELSKTASPEEVGRYLDASTRLRLKLAATGYALLIVLVVAMQYPPVLRVAALILGVSMFTSILSSELVALIRARERMELDSVVAVTMAALNLGLSYTILANGYGLRALACLAVLISILGGACLLALGQRFLRVPRLVPSPELERPLFRAAWPLGVGALLYQIYDRADVLILWKIAGEAVTGVYSVAYSLLGIGKMVASASVAAVIPAMSSLSAEHTRAELLSTSTSAVRMMSVLGGGYVLTVWLVAEPVVGLFFGPAFADAAQLLHILAFSAGIISVGQVFGNLLVACNLPSAYVLLSGAGVVLNLSLNFWLIPLHGATGAAISTVATDVLSSVLAYVLVTRRLGYVPTAGHVLRAAATAALVGAACSMTHPDLVRLAWTPLALAAYLGLLYLSGGLSRTELSIMAKLLRRRKTSRGV